MAPNARVLREQRLRREDPRCRPIAPGRGGRFTAGLRGCGARIRRRVAQRVRPARPADGDPGTTIGGDRSCTGRDRTDDTGILARIDGRLTRGTVEANGLRFAYLEAGSGPLALCLHGFPDSPFAFRHLLPALARAGYRAVAPFMRGYAPTEVPVGGPTRPADLVADALALHEALGGGPAAVLIGHDWGAAVVYGAAPAAPERWRRVVAMAVPPTAVYARFAFDYAQAKRSFYFWFLQMAVADGVVAAGDLAYLDGFWSDWSPGYDAAEDLVHAKACLRDLANLRAAIGYYRGFFEPAYFGSPEAAAEVAAVWGRPTPQPSLYLHGRRDGCMALDDALLAAVPAAFGPRAEAAWVEGAGHFLLVERPEEVNRRILEFLAG